MSDKQELLACPFCGVKSNRVDTTTDYDGNKVEVAILEHKADCYLMRREPPMRTMLIVGSDEYNEFNTRPTPPLQQQSEWISVDENTVIEDSNAIWMYPDVDGKVCKGEAVFGLDGIFKFFQDDYCDEYSLEDIKFIMPAEVAKPTPPEEKEGE